MSSDTACLALVLDAPMQSWGFESRFQRRTTGLHPTKSGVIGMICAALGLAKGSPEEQSLLPMLARLEMTSLAIPRIQAYSESGKTVELPVSRLEDFHTVLKTRRASGKISADKEAVVTRRQYLVDARFGVMLQGDHALLKRVAAGIQDPVWGVWFGRKHCIPAAIIFAALSRSQDDAWRGLMRACRLDEELTLDRFTTVTEARRFAEGTDSLADQPLSFGDQTSSGPDRRRFAVRRVRVQPGLGLSKKE